MIYTPDYQPWFDVPNEEGDTSDAHYCVGHENLTEPMLYNKHDKTVKYPESHRYIVYKYLRQTILMKGYGQHLFSIIMRSLADQIDVVPSTTSLLTLEKRQRLSML